ncbi:hypothetical protein [Vreelandella olivaria]|uniref:hypothetical protein n=1 Tax=Vreelandella olivaria TaxID=390919 RepID=UPI00201F958B|nr:hypothetical protein [Halomonas olivaria]
MQPSGTPSHSESTSRRITRTLGLCCFLVLMFGSSSHLHAPHFKDVKQTSQSFSNHTDQRSFAYLPELPRIRHEAQKKLSGDPAPFIFDSPVDDAFLSTYFSLQSLSIALIVSLSWIVFLYRTGDNRRPPPRAPPARDTHINSID